MTDPPPVLEREVQVGELEAARARAAEGTGGVVLVCGEAGIGKTTLVDLFSKRMREAETPVLWGACDALRTPRPLGPLLDIARSAGGRLQAVAGGEPRRERLFSAFLDRLQRRDAPVVVVEDVHWADDATLDLLTFLGRRIRDTHSLLIVTYRDDETPPGHPLRDVVATLPRDSVRRLALPRLSKAAVADLARRAGRAPGDLHALTSGNPFYVSEVLACDGDTVPPSVQDAVFARAGSLSAPARRVLDAVAQSPGHLERWLLDAVLDPRPEEVRACFDVGVLVADDGDLSFRHELARQAWRDTVDGARSRELHGRLFAALEARSSVETARLVHHAAGTGDERAILRLAPRAGAEAARLGAHREAAVHYETALGAAGDLEPARRAELLETLSRESYLTGRNERAVEALDEALEIRHELGDRRMQSEDERWLARLAWYRGDHDAVRRHGEAAVEAVEALGPTRELARAYCTRSRFLMCAEVNREALDWGERALEMARASDDLDTVVHSLINIGASKLMMGDPSGRGRLEEALELAREHDLHDHAGRALLNLAEIAIDWRDMTRAEADVEAGIAFCAERDMDPYTLCGIGHRALLRLWTGQWSEAAADAVAVLDRPRAPAVDRIPPLVVLGLLRARRGDPGAWDVLDEALDLAAPTREQHRIAPVAAARAEAAWLEGDGAAAADEVRVAYEMAVERDNPWVTGSLALWLWRADALETVPGDVAEPYARLMAGEPVAAAAAWERLGFPYDRALALAECEDAATAREALRILHDLGAAGSASAVAAALRDQGVENLPRGPRRSTSTNPAGLTRRQLQVLDLLGEGLTNRGIAGRLHISPKTVEHHVSAVLAKLEVDTRTEAALVAAEMDRPEPGGPRPQGRVP